MAQHLHRLLAALSLTIAICVPSPVRASQDQGPLSIVVFQCVNGTLQAKNLSLSPAVLDGSLNSKRDSLLRQGLAVPLQGESLLSAKAAAEGLGIWRFASSSALFQMLGVSSPSQLMAAIALTESGRNGWYWPWTINHDGKSLYFGSMSKAVAHAKQLIAAGVSRFDVGLMQVNWHWNGHRFDSIEDAFNPIKNIHVADKIMQEHYRATGSWTDAAGRYHSKTPSLKNAYQQRVYKNYETVVQQPSDLRNQKCVTS